MWDKEASEVNLGFKRLVAYLASRTHGCNYSMSHAAEAAHRLGVDDAKLDAAIDYRTSPLFTEAERVALDFAVAAASQPNGVTSELFEKMKRHWTDAQIVEIAGAVALNGFPRGCAVMPINAMTLSNCAATSRARPSPMSD